MDIISSLSTLSFDKRRSAFFTNELLTILKLIDNKIVDQNFIWFGLVHLVIFNLCSTTIKNMQLIIIIII